MKRRRARSELQSEINVTPLVDVVLVLLIIFMVITPYLQRGVDLKLPFAENVRSREESGEEPVIVSMRRDGKLFLGTEELTKQALLARLQVQLRGHPDREILLKGDERLRYGQVRELLEWLRASGAPAVSLATDTREHG